MAGNEVDSIELSAEATVEAAEHILAQVDA